MQTSNIFTGAYWTCILVVIWHVVGGFRAKPNTTVAVCVFHLLIQNMVLHFKDILHV
jgi:hypothetical protein